MSQSNTLAPASMNAVAITLPMPDAAAVTTAPFPVNRFMFNSSVASLQRIVAIWSNEKRGLRGNSLASSP